MSRVLDVTDPTKNEPSPAPLPAEGAPPGHCHGEGTRCAWEEEVADLRAALSTSLAEVERLREALVGLPCMFVWQGRREGKSRVSCPNTTGGDPLTEYLPEHAWCPVCRARAAPGAPPKEPT
jgi:hypothetical protein